MNSLELDIAWKETGYTVGVDRKLSVYYKICIYFLIFMRGDIEYGNSTILTKK